FFRPFSLPDQPYPNLRKCLFDEFAHGVSFAGRKHIIIGLGLLQDLPHSLNVIARMSPVALGVEIAKEQCLLRPELDGRYRARDLSCDEGLASSGTLVIEQDAIRSVHAVGLLVVDRDPISIHFCRRIWGARIKGRGLALGRFPHETEQLRSRSLIKADASLHPEDSDGFE